jgi:hypothetical protein
MKDKLSRYTILFYRQYHWYIEYQGTSYKDADAKFNEAVFFGTPCLYIKGDKAIAKTPSVKLTRRSINMPVAVSICSSWLS